MRRGEGGGALLEGPKDTMDGSTEPALNTPLPYPRHDGGYAFHHAKFPDRNGFVVIYPQAVLPPLQQVNRSHSWGLTVGTNANCEFLRKNKTAANINNPTRVVCPKGFADLGCTFVVRCLTYELPTQ